MKKLLQSLLALMVFFHWGYAEEFELTIFHTNDTHGRGFEDQKAIGYAKMASYLKQYRAENKEVLLLDAGDTFNGVPNVDLSLGKAGVLVMNQMKFDAFIPGNVDFSYGGQQLLALKKLANFPFISTNIFYKNKLAFLPYITREIKGLNFAIIGVSPMNSMLATTDDRLKDFKVTNAIEAVKKTVSEIQKSYIRADFIIVVTHLGKIDPAFNVEKLVKAVPGIDIVIDGHDHIALKEGMKIGNTVIVNAGQYHEYLGKLKLLIRDKEIISTHAELLSVDYFKDVIPDEEVDSLLHKIKEENKILLDKVAMKLPFVLEGRRELVRSQQTSLGTILADAQRKYSKADVSVTVGAFLRESIEAGDVAYGKVLSALPFNLPLVTRKLTGKQLIEFMENNYNNPDIMTPAYIHVSGMSFTVDFNRPAGQRMVDIKIDNKPIKLNKTYLLAANEQMSDFGIRDITIEKRYPITMAQLLIDYINKNPKINLPSSQITIIKPLKMDSE